MENKVQFVNVQIKNWMCKNEYDIVLQFHEIRDPNTQVSSLCVQPCCEEAWVNFHTWQNYTASVCTKRFLYTCKKFFADLQKFCYTNLKLWGESPFINSHIQMCPCTFFVTHIHKMGYATAAWETICEPHDVGNLIPYHSELDL